MRILPGIVLLLAPLGAAAFAQQPIRPQVAAVRTDAPPRLDGILDDACWAKATTFTEFTLQAIQKPLQFSTTAYLCYDENYLYAALRAEDPEPARIVAQETKRNGRIWDDDVLEIAIDPRHQFQDYYWFCLTPNGTQYEEVPGGSSTNITWRGDWKGAASRTPTGWAAEFAIPWKMLHPRGGTTAMGVFFARKVARVDDWALSPNLGTRWDPRAMADWTGLPIPTITPPPVFMAYQQMEFTTSRRRPSIGMDVKQQTPTGHNWLVTINPDFENIESAVESVDFSYTERYIPDRRPFFTEGRDYFPGDDLFYTQRIRDVWFAGKAYAPAQGRLGYSALATVGPHGQDNFVSGLSYRLADKPERRVWLNNVLHVEPGLTNHVINGGGLMEFFRKGGRTYLFGEFRQSMTGGAHGDGTSMSASLNFDGDDGRLSHRYYVNRVGRSYDPAIGFQPETDYQEAGIGLNYQKKAPRGFLESYGGYAGGGWRDHLDGRHFTDGGWGGVWTNVRPSLTLGVNASAGYRDPDHNDDLSFSLGWNRRDMYRRGDVSFSFGHADGGVHRQASVGQSYRARKDLGFGIGMQQARIDYPAFRNQPPYKRAQLVASFNYDISPERGLGGRLVMGGPDLGRLFGSGGKRGFYFTYRQAVRRGVDAYVIVGDPSSEDWEPRFAFKLLTPF